LTWSENDPEGREMVEKWAPNRNAGDSEVFDLRNAIMKRYGYGMMKDGTDYNLLTTVLFNPCYSLGDIRAFLNSQEDVFEQYMPLAAAKGLKEMSLLGRYDYAMPYYNINGDMDYQTNFEIACEYFKQVNAPKKQLFVMKNATHGLLESRSEEFSGFIHQIAAL